jgi:uncharacterized protein YecT (DUF1311 family)
MLLTPRYSLFLVGLLLSIATGCRPAANPTDSAQISPASTSPPSVAVGSDSTSTTVSPAISAAPAIASSPIAADSPRQPINCNNPQSVDVDRCAQIAYEAADAQLNQSYQVLKESLNAQEQQQLTEVELAWIEFRDRHCDFKSSAETTTQPTVRYQCLTEATQRRTEELRAQAAPL